MVIGRAKHLWRGRNGAAVRCAIDRAATAPPNPAFDHAKYDAIGESDRMTLKFVKPR